MSVPDTSIRPGDIDLSRNFVGAFGHRESEVAAKWIVRFCQERGTLWEPIPLSELQAFYARSYPDDFGLFQLVYGYVKLKDGLVHILTPFVIACHRAAPANS